MFILISSIHPRGCVVYNTFPNIMYYSNIEGSDDDVYLYVKYFNSGEIMEIAHTKKKSINFYIFDNKIDYYYIENEENIFGSYIF